MIFRIAKSGVRKLFNSLGYELVRANVTCTDGLVDIDDTTKRLFDEVKSYTLSGIERVDALRKSVEYVVRSNVPGQIVECGVWKGGSMMAIAKTLQRNNASDRQLVLFDTFEGMPPPSSVDVNFRGHEASALLDSTIDAKNTANVWAIAPLEGVKKVMCDTGYDEKKITYVQGRVENTIPVNAPAQIALLRLDTDWYESTYHELVHLYPRLSVGGVLIIDDYGHWQGARRAVDQYIAENDLRLLLNRVDYTCRVCVKIDPSEHDI